MDVTSSLWISGQFPTWEDYNPRLKCSSALKFAPASSNNPVKNAQNIMLTDSANGPYTSAKFSHGNAMMYPYFSASDSNPMMIAVGITALAGTFPLGSTQ